MTAADVEPFANMKCDCCGRSGVVGVASSGYAAISFAWCAECLKSYFHPEPEWVLMYLYYDVGDHGAGLVDDEYLPGTWKDGHYWSWSDWRDWRRTQPDPPPDPYWDYYDSTSWTGRYPRDPEEVNQWLLNLAWPQEVAPWGRPPAPRWQVLLRRWLAFCWCWDDYAV